MAIVETFISVKMLPKLIKPLVAAFKQSVGQRNKELTYLQDIFGDCVSLAKYYIEPDSQTINPADEEEDKALLSARGNIFKTINHFFSREIPTQGCGNNQMFILADAGMGKTSLLMILKLTHLQGFWPKSDKCKLLKLGKNSIEEINKIEDKTNTILLLDSLDEDPQCKDGKTIERLTKILDNTIKFKRVIITCRTQFFPDDNANEESVFKTQGKISFAGYNCPLNYLSLFSDEQVEEYIHKRYPNSWLQTLTLFVTRKKNPKVTQANKALQTTDSLQFRPFLLAHIEDIIEAVVQGINEYQVYHTLIDKWLDREIKKLRKKGQQANQKDLLLVCIWIAETMARNNSHTVTLKEIEQFCQKESRIQLLSKNLEKVVKTIDRLDISTNSLLNRNSAGNFRFSHLSIREFLIVYGIEKGLLSGIKQPFIATDKMANFLKYTELNHPFQFRHKNNYYVLYGSKLTSREQLQQHDLRNAMANWPQFLSSIKPQLDVEEDLEIELETFFLKTLYRNDEIFITEEQAELRRLLKVGKTAILHDPFNPIQRRCKVKARQIASVISSDYLDISKLKTKLKSDFSINSGLNEMLIRDIAMHLLHCPQLQKIDLSRVQLYKVDLDCTNLDQANLELLHTITPNFYLSKLNKANLKGADLTGGNLSFTSLMMADLTNTKLINANLNHADLKGANLRCADLTGAVLTDVDLRHSNLTGAILTDVVVNYFRTIN